MSKRGKISPSFSYITLDDEIVGCHIMHPTLDSLDRVLCDVRTANEERKDQKFVGSKAASMFKFFSQQGNGLERYIQYCWAIKEIDGYLVDNYAWIPLHGGLNREDK